MPEAEKAICIFIHHSIQNELPYNVLVYCKELSSYFDELVIVSNNKSLKLKTQVASNIVVWDTYNLGYDFGMFYRFSETIDFDDYKQIALVNDSNFTINSLSNVMNWSTSNNAHLWGIIDSVEKPWFSDHPNNYHIQSHFLVFNKKALPFLSNYLKKINVDEIFSEKDLKKVRRMVINHWEIGLSQYFLSQNLNLDSFVRTEDYQNKYNVKEKSLTIARFKDLVVNENYPLIKKKVINRKQAWYKRNDNSWKELILEMGNNKWDLKRMIEELENK